MSGSRSAPTQGKGKRFNANVITTAVFAHLHPRSIYGQALATGLTGRRRWPSESYTMKAPLSFQGQGQRLPNHVCFHDELATKETVPASAETPDIDRSPHPEQQAFSLGSSFSCSSAHAKFATRAINPKPKGLGLAGIDDQLLASLFSLTDGQAATVKQQPFAFLHFVERQRCASVLPMAVRLSFLTPCNLAS